MKLFRKEDLLSAKNGLSREAYRENVLTDADNACALGGLLLVIPPNVEGQFHYHVKRESVQVFLSGEAIGCFTDSEIPLKAGDVLFIPAGEKHRISNRSDKEARFIEFFTEPPLESDFVPVESNRFFQRGAVCLAPATSDLTLALSHARPLPLRRVE